MYFSAVRGYQSNDGQACSPRFVRVNNLELGLASNLELGLASNLELGLASRLPYV
jgi:hypothetical protein